MVYDADTGEFKHMWGAYGNKPLDMAARPPRSKASGEPWTGVSEVLQQFGSPAHDVDISKDGHNAAKVKAVDQRPVGSSVLKLGGNAESLRGGDQRVVHGTR